jgi:hypothetical protein
MDQANTVYSAKPWASNEERLLSQALSVADTPGAILQETVRPPLPRVQLFPPRFGYRTEQPTIQDVLMNLDATFPGARVDYSGSQSGYQGTSYPSMNVW